MGLSRSHLASEPVALVEGAGPHVNDEEAWSTAECGARPWSGDRSETGGCAGDSEAVWVRRERGMVLSQLQLSPRPLSLGLPLALLRVPGFVRLSLFLLDSTYLHPHLWCLQRFLFCAVRSPPDSCQSAHPCWEVGRIQRCPS